MWDKLRKQAALQRQELRRLLETHRPMFGSRKLIIAALALMLAAGVVVSGQAQETKPAPPPVKIGVLPFDDASGEAGGATEAVAKWLRAEMALDKRLLPKLLSAGEGPLDRERALALGKEGGVEFVLTGTIVQADVETSSGGVSTPALGQIGIGGVGGGYSSAKATAVLQGELLRVSNGEVLFAERVTGKKTETRLRGDVQTSLGGVDFNAEGAQNTPLGKALKEAVQKLTQAVAQKTAKPNVGATKIGKQN